MFRRWAQLGGDAAPVWSRVSTALLFAVGASLFPEGTWHPHRVLFWLGVRWIASVAWSKKAWLRVPGRLALVFVLAAYLPALYLTLFATLSMGWSTPVWLRAVMAEGFVGSLIGPFWRFPWRVPLSLVLGLWLVTCVRFGDYPLDNKVACDDYLRIGGAARVIVPTRRDLAQCKPGEELPLGRFPRFSWESPDGSRYLFTSHEPNTWQGPPAPVDTVTGLLCETPAAGTDNPRCVGSWQGVSQGIHSIPSRHQVLVGAVAGGRVNGNGPGDSVGIIWSLPEDGSLRILSQQEFRNPRAGLDLQYFPDHDRLWLFSDDPPAIRYVRAADFTPLPNKGPDGWTLGWDYDPGSDDGVVCGILHENGIGWGTLLSFKSDTFAGHWLISLHDHPWLLGAIPSSCVFSRDDRKLFVLMPNYALLARFDLASNRIEDFSFVGPGYRNLTYDAPRHRLYVTDFLGHDVIALDAHTLREVRRWPAGRFAREVRLSNDGRSLLVGGTVGLVRIDLTE